MCHTVHRTSLFKLATGSVVTCQAEGTVLVSKAERSKKCDGEVGIVGKEFGGSAPQRSASS